MSRHGGKAGRRWPCFQIEVVDYSKRRNGYRTANFDGTCSIGFAVKNQEKFNVRKIADMPVNPRHRTLVEHFKDVKAAMQWGRRFGTVISCRKVDIMPYLANIEYLNLIEKPITAQLDREEYVVNKALELSRPRIKFQDKKFDIQIVDNEKSE